MITTLAAWLLGQRPAADKALRLQEAFRNYRAPGEASPFAATRNLIIVIACVVAILFIVVKISQRSEKPLAKKSPRRFFSLLLKQLGASLTDRILFQLAARHSGLPHPAAMLIDPRLLEQHAGAWADSFNLSPIRNYIRSRFNNVARQAFENDYGDSRVSG